MSTSASLSLDSLPLLVPSFGKAAPLGAPSVCGPRALLAGSFNPVHRGHWELALAAERLLGVPVAFELSIANVDKAELQVDEVQRRLGQFTGRADLWITRASHFTDKAELFPGTMFVVGADTAWRLIQPRYYGDDESKMLHALVKLHEQRCRFLVGGRVDGAGRFVTLDQLAVPRSLHNLFTPIPAEMFRCDVSSTQVRAP